MKANRGHNKGIPVGAIHELPLPLLIIIAVLLFSAASANPNRDHWRDGEGPSIPAIQQPDKDWAAIFQQSDLIISGLLHRITSERMGFGAVPIKEFRIHFHDIKILKGPSINQTSFRTMPAVLEYSWPKNQRIIVCLKKESDAYKIFEMVEATEENLSLIL